MQELELRIGNRQMQILKTLAVTLFPHTIEQLQTKCEDNGNYREYHKSLLFLIRKGLVKKIRREGKYPIYFVVTSRGVEEWEKRA